MLGGTPKVKALGKLAWFPSGFRMPTLTNPSPDAGVTAVRLVGLSTVTIGDGVEPNVTAAPISKSVPLMVTACPPLVEPVFGVTARMLGGAAAFTVSVPLLVVTE